MKSKFTSQAVTLRGYRGSDAVVLTLPRLISAIRAIPVCSQSDHGAKKENQDEEATCDRCNESRDERADMFRREVLTLEGQKLNVSPTARRIQRGRADQLN
jgi:hypothetical protein